MKINLLFRAKILQFSILFMCSISGNMLLGSSDRNTWEVIDSEPKANPLMKVAVSYVSLNAASEKIQMNFDREEQNVFKNIGYCSFFGVTTGCAICYDYFSINPVISSINAVGFATYLCTSYISIKGCSKASDSLKDYRQKKELLRYILCNELGEENTEIIDNLTMSESDMSRLVSLIEDADYETVRAASE